MELYDVLNNYCRKNAGAVTSDDKRRHSYMLRRLFSAQYPLQCEIVNRLDTDAVCSSNIVALLASRYASLPNFLRMKVDQKKKKETIRKFFEDDVIDRYMEINECGIREVEEAFNFCPDEIKKSMNMIKKTFFPNKEKIIIEKVKKVDLEESKLF